jgi:hypothetical protein
VQHVSQHHNLSPKKEQIMSTPRKSTRTSRAAAESAEVAASFVPVYTKTVERLADLQKKSLDAVAGQSAELAQTCKKAFHLTPETPGLFWLEALGQSLDRYVETQKEYIDLAVEQTETLTGLAEERGAFIAKFTDNAAALVQQTVDHATATQKKNLEFCAEQQRAAYETAKKQFRVASPFFANPFTEMFQSGVDLLLETQKSVLDIASRPAKHATAA